MSPTPDVRELVEMLRGVADSLTHYPSVEESEVWPKALTNAADALTALSAEVERERRLYTNLAEIASERDAKIAELQVEVERLRAEREPWRPIETAPRGTDVLLWEKYADVPVVGFWRARAGWRQKTGWTSRKDHLYVDGDACLEDQLGDVTHWMPLPAPPEPVGAAHKEGA